MKALSRLVLFLTLFSFVAQPVMADSLTSNDLNFAFGGGTAVSKTINQPASSLTKAKRPPQQLASLQPLSDQEMQETEGAWLNFAIGGATGLGSYLYTTPRSSWSWGDAARNTAYGLVGGGGARVAGVRAWASWNSRGGGISFGRNFRVDAHRFTHQGRSVWRPHYHRRPGVKHHRPWQRGW